MAYSLRGAGRMAAKCVAKLKAALTLSSTVMRRTRSISAFREAAWLTLGRGRGSEGWTLIPAS
jgi:hypothetical protein